MRTHFTYITLLAALVSLGCDPDDSSGTETDSDATTQASETDSDTEVENDACTFISGKSLGSVSKMECGLGPNGPFLCTWVIVFSDAMTFEFNYSDLMDSGSITCDGAMFTAEGEFGTYEGMVDFDADSVTIDGNEYQPLGG